MKVTFLVTTDEEVPDFGAKLDLASEIQDDLLSDGYNIISVKPWDSPGPDSNPSFPIDVPIT